MAEDDHLAYGDYHRGSPDTQRGLLGELRGRGGVSSLLGKLSGAVQDISSDITGRFSDLKVGAQYIGGNEHRFGSFAQTREGNEVKWFVDGCGYFWAVSEAIERARKSIWIMDWWLSPELYLRRPPSLNEQYRLDRLLKAAAERGVKINVIVYKEVPQALTLSSEYTKHTLEALHPNIAVFRHPDHLPDAQTLQSSLASSLAGFSLTTDSVAKLSEDALKAIYGANQDVILFWAHHEKLLLVDEKIAFMGGLDLCYGRWDTVQHSISDVHPANINSIVFPGQDYNNARIMDFQNVSQPEQNKVDRTESSRMGWSDISVSLRGPVIADLEAHFVQRWNFIYRLKYDVRQDHRYGLLPIADQQSNANPQTQNVSGVIPQQSTDVRPGLTPARIQHSVQPAWQAQAGNQGYPPPPPGSPPSHQSSQYYPPPPPGGPPGRTSGQECSTPSIGTHSPQTSQQYYPPQYVGGSPQPGGQYYPPPPAGKPDYQNQTFPPPPSGPPDVHGNASIPGKVPYFTPPPSSRGAETFQSDRGFSHAGSSQNQHQDQPGRLHELEERGFAAADRFSGGRLHNAYDKYSQSYAGRRKATHGTVAIQLVRSAGRWSNGTDLEHSIQAAYINTIRAAQKMLYIENQFFITATSPKQAPVLNKIGAALVERVVRAGRTGEKFKIVVIIPSVPGFAGDLRDDSSLGTRAIMEFQYNSISRGGYSIMEAISQSGFNPMDYIRFYNLRNYDRINYNPKLQKMERDHDVAYEDVRRQAEDILDPMGRKAQDGNKAKPASVEASKRFEKAASETFSENERHVDSVAHCYMLGGPDIRTLHWDGDGESEISAFVSEELYIHSKVLIADDRVVICGSANLNDRSQLGNHDSEIALVIEDQDPLDSYMDGRPWKASRFAATLRRQLYRKHLGLLAPQHMMEPDSNFHPIGIDNDYDFGSPEDHLVQDPIADTFLNFWNTRARRNTEAFRHLFHPVPDDTVRNWTDYNNFYEKYFKEAAGDSKAGTASSKYIWGHVVREEFAPGPEGVKQIKDMLSTIKGTLVEMPLMFLIEENIAQQGLSLNSLTEPIYT